MIIVDHDKVEEYSACLIDTKQPIAQRVNALFCLRTVASLEAVDALFNAFEVE